MGFATFSESGSSLDIFFATLNAFFLSQGRGFPLFATLTVLFSAEWRRFSLFTTLTLFLIIP
jgi:hypothetical protein